CTKLNFSHYTMNRILVPTDLSDIANFGLDTAIGLAKKIDAQIFLLNAITPIYGSNFSAMGIANASTVSEETRYVMELHKRNEARLAKIAKEKSTHEIGRASCRERVKRVVGGVKYKKNGRRRDYWE